MTNTLWLIQNQIQPPMKNRCVGDKRNCAHCLSAKKNDELHIGVIGDWINPGVPCGKEVSARTLLQGARLRASINQKILCIPFVHSICPADPLRPRARAPPPRCGRLQARRRTISPDAIDLHAPFAARLEALALRRRCARTPKSGQLVPALRPTDGAECARVLCRWCGGEGADAARRAAQPAPNVVPRPAA